MKKFQFPLRILSIIAVLFIAWTLRARAVEKLPIDYDEDDYTRAGQEYAHLIRTSDWSGFLETNYRPEHPPLAKIVYGFAFSFQPDYPLVADVPITANPTSSLPEGLRQTGRNLSAIFGAITAFLLAIVNPLGGFLLSIHTFTIKYTSQIMLDGLSALLSMSAVLAYAFFKKSRRNGWIIFSAFLLGLAADSKYLHGTVGLAILADWLLENKSTLSRKNLKAFAPILGWGVLSLVIFFVFNPYLWLDPLGRLSESFFSVQYTTTNPNVERAGFPVWQQLTWLSMSVPWHNDPPVFIFMLDTFIAVLAVFGFKRLWNSQRVFALWLAIDIFILLIWPTKWPQYILIVTAPLSLSAAEGVTHIWQHLIEFFKNHRKETYNKKETRQSIPWLVPGLIAFAVLTLLPFIFQLGVSITDFNSASIRDGFQGGIWREVSGGLTGKIEAVTPEFPFRSKEVQFTGLSGYMPVFEFITGNGVFVFNILWMVASTSLQVILGFGLAILLNQRGVTLGKFWQALFILPWAIPEFIGALMWLNIFVPEIGWLSLAAQKYGDAFPLQFLIGWEKSASMWFLIFLIPAVWYGFPLIMLAANAGLKSIPTQVFEAASIDGANSIQMLRYMTLPLLLPLLLPAIIIRGIYAFNQFYLFQAFLFTDSTLATLSYNLFNPSGGFGGGQFAVSAIINILTVVILIVLVNLFNRQMQTREEFRNA
jgi:ABC-type sugar transport system permease subunit